MGTAGPLCHTTGHFIAFFALSYLFVISSPNTYICDPSPVREPSLIASPPLHQLAHYLKSIYDGIEQSALMDYARDFEDISQTPEKNESTVGSELSDSRPRKSRVKCSALRMPFLNTNENGNVRENRYHRFDDYDLEEWLAVSGWAFYAFTAAILGTAKRFLITDWTNLCLQLLGLGFASSLVWLFFVNDVNEHNRLDPRFYMKVAEPDADEGQTRAPNGRRRRRRGQHIQVSG